MLYYVVLSLSIFKSRKQRIYNVLTTDTLRNLIHKDHNFHKEKTFSWRGD